MNIAEVIPLARFPHGIEFFDYQVPDDLTNLLSVGSLVHIPFRGRQLTGAVWNIKDGERKNVKQITKILGESSLADERERLFLAWFASFYAVSLPTALTLFINNLPAKPKSSAEAPQSLVPMAGEDHEQWQTFLHAEKPIVCMGQTLQEKEKLLLTLGQDVLSNGKQALFLSPTVQEAHALYDTLARHFGASVWRVHSDGGIHESYATAMHLARKTPALVVGTRSALFSYMPNVSLIVLDSCERDEYKQYDQNPRYDARECAQEMARIFTSRLIMCSPAPRLEEMRACAQGIMTLVDRSAPADISLVSLPNEWRGGRKGFISEALEDAMTLALSQGKHVVLFHNRKGTSTFIVCKDCEYFFSCDNCSNGLTYFQKDGILRCAHCGFEKPMPSTCPSCSGACFQFSGTGTEKIHLQLREMFPNRDVFEVTKETFKKRIQFPNEGSAPSIVVGTSAMIPHLSAMAGTIGCYSILSSDPVRTPRSFRSTEEHWRLLSFFSMLARSSACKLFLQAFDVNSSFLSKVRTNAFSAFYDEEYDEREAYHWPPADMLVKILAQKKGGSYPEAKLMELRELINGMETDPEHQIFAFPIKEEGRYATLLMRISGKKPITLPYALESAINRLPAGFFIDKNPLSV